MNIDLKQIASMSEANQNFSKVSKMADTYNKVLILKNNKPKYVLVNIENGGFLDLTFEERIDCLSKRIINERIDLYRELIG